MSFPLSSFWSLSSFTKFALIVVCTSTIILKALKAYGEPSAAGGVNPDVVSVWVRVTENLTQLKSWDNVIVAGRRALFLLRHSKHTLLQGSPRSSSKKSPIRITSDTYYDALFTTLQCLGQAHTSLSNYPLARDACSESLQLAWEMALSSHNDLTTAASSTTKSNEVLRVIRALKRLGKAHLLQGQYSPALECFLPSLELLRSSKETEMTMDCASVLGSLGFLYLKLKKFTESSNFLRQCLRLYRKNGEFLLYPLRIISLFQEQLIRPKPPSSLLSYPTYICPSPLSFYQ